MSEPSRCLPSHALVVGFDFSTGGAKALAFDLHGNTVASVKLPTDLWTDYLPTDDPKLVRDTGNRELSGLFLEGQVRAATRAIAAELAALGRLKDWLVSGISATHHSAGRIDANHNPIRRIICWNDQTLAEYHAEGLKRLGGQERAVELTGGPWAVRYSLSHLVKDSSVLPQADWNRTKWMLPHGPLAAGYLTDRWGVTSVSSAASTGIMNLRTNEWRREMLDAVSPEYRESAWNTLPKIVDMNSPVGRIAEHLALDANLPSGVRPLVYPTLDDQAAGLIGGGAVDAGQVAIILGNSAVVNSSSAALPNADNLDAMKLNWGPYLWMRCYSNGAQFLDRVVGPNRTKEQWQELTASATRIEPRCGGVSVLPFLLSEPSLGVTQPRFKWTPSEPSADAGGVRVRASFEAIAYLIALGVRAHEAAGQKVTRVSVSGGIAKNDLMVKILASVLNKPLDRLVSDEGSALGAAVVALAGAEANARSAARIAEPFTAADAVAMMVKFKDRVEPEAKWVETYRAGLAEFEKQLHQ
ncbi:MAG: xylulose kinase [Planctomycetes bacterium]|nr:xylulose kinase [Planctomycetota bacterium]